MIEIIERWRHLREGIYELSEESEQLAIDSGKAVKIEEEEDELDELEG